MVKYNYITAALFALSLGACKKDNPEPELPDNGPSEVKGLIVSCEGQFQQGNATVVLLNSDFQSVYGHFEEVNEVPLGDILQSITPLTDGFLLAVNGSGTVIRTDLNLKRQAETGGFSPRYIHIISGTKAYVTDLFSNEIAVLNPENLSITSTIATGGWTEQILAVGDRLWVVDKTNNQILILNPFTDEVEDQILLTDGAGDMVLDSEGKVWVMCTGPWSGPGNGALYRINPTTNGFMESFQFAPGETLGQLKTDWSGQNIYYTLGSAVFNLSILDEVLPTLPLLTVDFFPYGLDIDPVNGDIYLCDPADFVNLGSVHRYTSDGVFVGEYTTGVNPNHVYFFSR